MNMISTQPALHPLPPVIPENAPFNQAQRAWLNGFFAGLLGAQAGPAATDAGMSFAGAAVPAPAESVDTPWHDPALELPERMRMAEGRPLQQRLMAAMGQLDCGQCGYDCHAYAEKLADRSEAKTSLCVPGGRVTRRMLETLLAEAAAPPAAVKPEQAKGGRAAAVTAKLKEMRPLNAPGSVKDTRHVAIDLAGTGLAYEPGDSLGVVPENDPALVEAVLATLGASPDLVVEDGVGRLADHLRCRLDLRQITDALLLRMAEVASDPAEAAALRRLADGDDADGLLETGDVLDLLEVFPSARPAVSVFVGALDELQPRLYSISSAPAAHPGEVHLTVGVVREEKRGRLRHGVASTYFADRLGQGAAIRVYRQPSHGFRLPLDPAVPIVMIGPGTGIAPFRAFLEARVHQEGRGDAWLFFGNPSAATDFLYRDELEAFLAEGTLTRLDTAFSRDQAEKIYVQNRLEERGEELWRWLERGAHLYVCGDARRMARDVDEALRRLLTRHAGMSRAAADAYVAELAKAGRYQRDVY
jgi:sulfite reductase (NADPH) flavoprotein alpha-component